MHIFTNVPEDEMFDLILQHLHTLSFRYASKNQWRKALGEYVVLCGRSYSDHTLTLLTRECLAHFTETGALVKDDDADYYFLTEGHND